MLRTPHLALAVSALLAASSGCVPVVAGVLATSSGGGGGGGGGGSASSNPGPGAPPSGNPGAPPPSGNPGAPPSGNSGSPSGNGGSSGNTSGATTPPVRPTVLSVVAREGGAPEPGLGAGDTVTFTWSEPCGYVSFDPRTSTSLSSGHVWWSGSFLGGSQILASGSYSITYPAGGANGTVAIGDTITFVGDTVQSLATQLFVNGSIALTGSFDPAPSVTSISPADGPIAGGTQVTITGARFATGATVRVGDAALMNVVVGSDTSISGVTSNTITVGAADIVVTTAAGSGTLSAGFDYRLGLVQKGAPYVVATTPHDLVAADLDADGDVDLALSHRNDSLTRLLGDGTGTFTTGSAITVSGKRLFGLAFAHLDGDGAQDLVATGIDDGQAFVLRGGAGGSYTLAAPVIGTSSTPYPELLALGDFDRDGALDAAIPLFGSGLGTVPSFVRVHMGDGAGHLVTSGTNLAVGNGPQLVKVLDLDGDGDLDIACTNLHSPGIGVLRGNGDGTFAAHELVATGTLSDGLAVADFDRDGRTDVIATHQLSAPVLVRSGASGALTTTTLTTSQAGHWRGIALDVNRDGWPDLVAGVDAQARCSVFVNDRTGGFAEHLLALPAAAADWSGLASADLDGDGRPDLAVMSNSQAQVTVFLNR